MRILVSGQAGKAVIFQGEGGTVISVQNPNEEYHCSAAEIPYLFMRASDTMQIELESKDKVLEELSLSWEKNLALQLCLILLDPDEPSDTRNFAADDISEYLKKPKVSDYISNILYSAPLPKAPNFKMLHFKDTVLQAFIEDLSKNQERIKLVRDEWEKLPLKFFSNNLLRKQEFEKKAVLKGAFRDFVNVGSHPSRFGSVWVDHMLGLSSEQNYRLILQSWVESFRPHPTQMEVDATEDDRDEEFLDDSKRKKVGKSYIRVDSILDVIEKQKGFIIKFLKRGDSRKAEKYVDELIDYQIKRGGPEYITKSLSHLSKLAEDFYSYNYQLEWSLRAYDYSPKDGFVHSHIAEAYINLGDYNAAMKWLKSAGELGSRDIEKSGLARINRKQGKLKEALEGYRVVCQEFPDNITGWLGVAKTFRDMWKLDEALDAYDEGINRFPHERRFKGGKGYLLKDLGELENSKEIFEENIHIFGKNVYDYAGVAETLKIMGRFQESLKYYTKAIKRFSDYPILHDGYASVLKEMEELPKALKKFEENSSQFPFDFVAWSGMAEVQKEMGNFERSKEIYSEGIKKFPNNAVMLNGKANVMKRVGEFKESLSLYDQSISKFPYNVYAHSGRADLLKELGYLDEAIDAYGKVEELCPRFMKTPHAKAAVFVAMKKYDKARALIPLGEPKTRDDWFAFHVNCMILLKTNRISEAKEKLEFGLKNNPFFENREYFQNSLAVINLREGKIEEARSYIRDDHTPLTNVIRIHFFGEANERQKAEEAYFYAKKRCTPILGELRDELGYHYQILDGKPKNTKEWIFEQLCNNILLKAA